jgi:hypothetical protein
MQSQMRGMPPGEPEPTAEQLRKAIWVVLAFPSGGGPMGSMGMPNPVVGPLREHLEAGGSALVLAAPQAEGLDEALGAFGVTVKGNLIAVHEGIAAPAGGASADDIDDARRRQYVFDLREYGEHPVTAPLRSLESLMVPLLPVQTKAAPGGDVIATPILPLRGYDKVWGEVDFEALQNDRPVTFDQASGDLPGPIYAGAAAERTGAGRLLVIGSPTFAFNFELEMPDSELARQGIYVSRFPANAELFMNSIFWLARMDPMIAISPSAMEVSRIRPMSAAALNGWRIGMLLVGIPGLVLLAGVAMYFSRRD